MSDTTLDTEETEPPFRLLTQVGRCSMDVPQGYELLAAVGFSRQATQRIQNIPVFDIGLPIITGDVAHELWLSRAPVRYGKSDAITYSENGTVLFGHLLLDETPDLQQASQHAYEQIFRLLASSGYGCLLRIWNYFPAITDALTTKLNRYQAFCLGRQAALNEHGNFAYSPPAATAIGTQQAGFQVYFIAAKHAGIQLENPRQTSAFLYPREYGPVSPAFSRATVKSWNADRADDVDNDGQVQHIYISGTTSIVGHKTLHVGDPLAQFDETLRNVQALVTHGHESLGLPIAQMAHLSQLKVYVHDTQYLPLIRDKLETALRTATEKPAVLYLQGDVCRADLQVEMEAIYA